MVSASNNLSVQIENLSAAKKSNRMPTLQLRQLNLPKLPYLKEAGTSVLARANSLPKTAIPLLQAM